MRTSKSQAAAAGEPAADAPVEATQAPEAAPQGPLGEVEELARLHAFRTRAIEGLRPSGPTAFAPIALSGASSTLIWRKLEEVIAGLPAIDKTGTYKNKKGEVQYHFVEQSEVVAMLRRRFAAVGLLTIPEIVERTQERPDEERLDMMTVSLKMAMHLIDTDTGAEQVYTWYAEANDWGDKSTQKAATSGHKYWLMKLTMMTDARDPDAENAVDGAEDRPRRTRTAAGTRTTTGGEHRAESRDAGQRAEELRRVTALAMTVGVTDAPGAVAFILDQLASNPDASPSVPGKRKRGAPTWFPAKVMAKIKQHSQTGGIVQFAALSDDEWARGLVATLGEVRQEHQQWCGDDCEHVQDYELSADPQDAPPVSGDPVEPPVGTHEDKEQAVTGPVSTGDERARQEEANDEA